VQLAQIQKSKFKIVPDRISTISILWISDLNRLAKWSKRFLNFEFLLSQTQTKKAVPGISPKQLQYNEPAIIYLPGILLPCLCV